MPSGLPGVIFVGDLSDVTANHSNLRVWFETRTEREAQALCRVN